MTWLSFFIGYSVGMTLMVLITKSLIESERAERMECESEPIDFSFLSETDEVAKVLKSDMGEK